jgi:hypothetical protein
MTGQPIINALDFDRNQSVESFDVAPDSCPRCHAKGTPNSFVNYAYLSPDQELLLVLQCPNRKCGGLFFAVYGRSGTDHFLRYLEPWEPPPAQFSEDIKQVSGRFCEIFQQAHHADELGLDEIAGPGYRKALEVLIKDFAKKPYSEALEAAQRVSDDKAAAESSKHLAAIETLLLVPCINKYIDDAKIKDVAQRAAWLGNDESHYIRRWPEKDVTALKALIALAVKFVESQLEYKRVLADMPEGR